MLIDPSLLRPCLFCSPLLFHFPTCSPELGQMLDAVTHEVAHCITGTTDHSEEFYCNHDKLKQHIRRHGLTSKCYAGTRSSSRSAASATSASQAALPAPHCVTLSSQQQFSFSALRPPSSALSSPSASPRSQGGSARHVLLQRLCRWPGKARKSLLRFPVCLHRAIPTPDRVLTLHVCF